MTARSTKTASLVEIGSNSTKLMIIRTGAGRTFTTIHFAKETTRIGAGLGAVALIQKRGVDRTIAAVNGFGATIARHHCDHQFAFATYALRSARNAGGVTRRLEKALGHPLRILSEKEEARFAYRSARQSLGGGKPNTLVVDVGGGSTEVVAGRSDAIRAARSVALGALDLTERFITSDPIESREFNRLTDHVDRVVRRTLDGIHIGDLAPAALEMVASGGAAASLARVIGRAGSGRPRPDRTGPRIRYGDVMGFLGRCLGMTLGERKRIRGLDPDRADIIPAGVAIIAAFMRPVRKRVLHINDGGVREGVMAYLIENDFEW